MNFKSLRPNAGTIIAVLALVLALGGSAVAAKRYLITNTKQISPKALQEIAAMAAKQGAAGPQGAQGARGDKGPDGDRGPEGNKGPTGEKGPIGDKGPDGNGGSSGTDSNIDWAVVSSDGTASRSSDAGVTATKLAPELGTYAVVFDHDLSNCAYQATVGRPGTEPAEDPGFVTVVHWSVDIKGVLVQTYGPNGILADKGFHLSVYC